MNDGSDARLDMLADLLAGEGSEQDVDSVADSPELSAALIDLGVAQAAVVADLARLPRPDVPAGLEDRIAAALAAAGAYEPTARVPVTGHPRELADRDQERGRDQERDRDQENVPVSHVTGHPVGSVVPLRRTHVPARNPWPLRAAAAVAIVTVGGLGFALLPRGGDSPSASTAAGGSAGSAASELPAVPTNNSGTDYAASPGLLEAAVPTLLGGAALVGQRAGSASPDKGRDGPQAAASAESAPSTADTSPVSPASSDPVLDRLRSPDELAGCLSAVSAPNVRLVPAALDYAAWDGEPALVVLVPTSQDAVRAGYDVFVVGADCRAGKDDLLHFERVPA